MKRDAFVVDFHEVPAHQAGIDARLINWGAWCKGRSARNEPAPMFRGSRTTDVWESTLTRTVVDGLDAQRIAKAVAHLPEQHRHGLQWHYVRPIAPLRMCRALGLSRDGLAQLVVDARTMLINRKV